MLMAKSREIRCYGMVVSLLGRDLTRAFFARCALSCFEESRVATKQVTLTAARLL